MVPISGKGSAIDVLVVLIKVVLRLVPLLERIISPCRLTVLEIIYRIGLAYLIIALPILELVYVNNPNTVAFSRSVIFKLVNILTTVNSLKVALEFEDDIVELITVLEAEIEEYKFPALASALFIKYKLIYKIKFKFKI